MASLEEVLQRAKDLGFLGPGPIADHVRHADAFGRLIATPPSSAVDLGSGGGVPGLVLALRWPETQWTLIDSNLRRTDFLAASIVELGLAERTTVVRGRAEEVGHNADLRERFDLVVSRSFAPPAPTAECASALLRVGGHLIVSEPPAGDLVERWPDGGLEALSLRVEQAEDDPRLVRLAKIGLLGERFPRPACFRRPLF